MPHTQHYARRMGQPTQRATNYTARSNIDTAQIFLHANGQRPKRAMIRQRSRRRQRRGEPHTEHGLGVLLAQAELKRGEPGGKPESAYPLSVSPFFQGGFRGTWKDIWPDIGFSPHCDSGFPVSGFRFPALGEFAPMPHIHTARAE